MACSACGLLPAKSAEFPICGGSRGRYFTPGGLDRTGRPPERGTRAFYEVAAREAVEDGRVVDALVHGAAARAATEFRLTVTPHRYEVNGGWDEMTPG